MTDFETQFTILYDALDRIRMKDYRHELLVEVKDIEKAVQAIRNELYLQSRKKYEWDCV